MQKGFMKASLRNICKQAGVTMVDRKVVHWMSHSQIDMFIFMVTHIENEEALAFADKAMKYFVAGCYVNI